MQSSLFTEATSPFPTTRYQGSKAKLINWIWDHLKSHEFVTCLDAFGGTGVVSHRLKKEGKAITYNDILTFNSTIATGLIENNRHKISALELNLLTEKDSSRIYPTFIADTFKDIYFTQEENELLDIVAMNIKSIKNKYVRSLAYFCIYQACIVKRPYNLFHRKNLYVRLAEVERSFGNKTSWDKSFKSWINSIAKEANNAVFCGKEDCKVLNKDVFEIKPGYELVYIDPPYTSVKGVGVDYRNFYHFLEGLTNYDDWQSLIDYKSKHRRLEKIKNPWSSKHDVTSAFAKIFEQFNDSILVVSYRSDGIPSVSELKGLLHKFKRNVDIHIFKNYKYVLSKNIKSSEILLIGY